MGSWFECKVKYDKTLNEGTVKAVSEPYLVNALSFTEAEARIIEELQPYLSGEYKVDTVKRVKLSELFFDESGDRWYKAKVNFITLDEKRGIEKRTACNMLVQASEFAGALKNLMDGMKGTLGDFEIASIAETPLLDVFQEDLRSADERQQAETKA